MERFDVALRAVRRAEAVLLSRFRSSQQSEQKSDGTLVSAVDRDAERAAILVIRRAFPQDRILSEESGELGGQSAYRWILDPLDGTHNFLAGLPLFGCLLALEHRGEVIASVCAFPALGERYTALRGKGAMRNGVPIRVATTRTLRGGLYCSDGRLSSVAGPAIASAIERFSSAGCRMRMFGSSPYAFAQVAAGSALIAMNHVGTPWDLAAPALLVEEAGGRVTTTAGRQWNVRSRAVIATNGIVHGASLNVLRSAH
jgi:fructose-1,6-bisphosphatase/inositol monophosphatase family enzyme